MPFWTVLVQANRRVPDDEADGVERKDGAGAGRNKVRKSGAGGSGITE